MDGRRDWDMDLGWERILQFGNGGEEMERRMSMSARRLFDVGGLKVPDGVTVENRPGKKGVTVSD